MEVEFPPKIALMQFPGLLQSSYFIGMPTSGVSLKDNCSYPLHHLLEDQNTPDRASYAKPISPEIITCCMSS